MKTKTDAKKQLYLVLFWQHVAGARNVPIEERYHAMARDVGAIHEGKEPTHTKELI